MPTVLLRQWRESDLDSYAAMNADPEVMRYFPARWSWAESEASLQRMRRAIDERGWGLWAVEVDGTWAGLTGLNTPTFTAPFTPCVEIGWRYRREFWGRGVAFQAAQQALAYGFETLRLDEIVAFTAAGNLRSRRLMERLGFHHDAGQDFEHPFIPAGHALRCHVLYRLSASASLSAPAGPAI